MVSKIIFICIIFFYLAANPNKIFAAANPLAVPNNKMGVHILFPDELDQAARLVNSNGGDYGYVTIAIQSGDKDIEKWQSFLDKAKSLHVIPIIRLATEGNYFNTAVWRKPIDNDIVDFANFLDSLNWPYQNRYIIVYNEVNRGDEWGGALNPEEYAKILSFAVTVFKSKNPDFFIISAGLDNAAPNQSPLYMNQYNYMTLMNNAIPGIFNQIDGLSSHSYPNPGFSQPPTLKSSMSINSFEYETGLVKNLTLKNLPVFITETGWATDVIPDNIAANYLITAFNTTWNHNNVVAVTPFLLQGTNSPFQKFSLLSGDKYTKQYDALKSIRKTKGTPKIVSNVLAATTDKVQKVPRKYIKFNQNEFTSKTATISPALKDVFKWLLKIN